MITKNSIIAKALNAVGGNIVGTRWVAKDDPLFIVRVLSESSGKIRVQSADGGTCTYSADEFKREYKLANSRSRNAIVQKALNAVARNGAMAALDSSEKSKIKSIASGMPCSFMDGGDSLSGVIKHSKRPFLYIDFDVSKSEIDGKPYYEWYVHAWNRTRKWERNGGQYKIEDAVSAAAQAMRGAKQMIEKWAGGVPLNAQTSVLRETAVNSELVNLWHVMDDAKKIAQEGRTNHNVKNILRLAISAAEKEEPGHPSIKEAKKILSMFNAVRTTNSVVAKALNARAVCNASYSAALKAIMDAVKPYMDRRIKDDTSWRYPALVISKLRDVCERAVMSAGRYDGKRPPHRVYDVECVKDGFKFSGNLIVSGLLHRDDPDDVSAFDEYDMILSLGYAGKA